MDNVTVIIVNYKTLNLTQACLSSFVRLFPDVPIRLIDNNSADKSSEYCKRASRKHPLIELMQMDKNIGHGPAMNRAILACGTRYFFTLDSDCEVLKRGFFRPMLDLFKEIDNLYAVGWLRWVNRDGVPAIGVDASNKHKYTPYIHPHAALFDKEKYLELPPFDYHGAPCYNNMRVAKLRGFRVRDYPIQHYIKHLGAGTRRMWGGAWDIRDRPPKKQWKKGNNYPL